MDGSWMSVFWWACTRGGGGGGGGSYNRGCHIRYIHMKISDIIQTNTFVQKLIMFLLLFFSHPVILLVMLALLFLSNSSK